jgi:hypothetical protein
MNHSVGSADRNCVQVSQVTQPVVAVPQAWAAPPCTCVDQSLHVVHRVCVDSCNGCAGVACGRASNTMHSRVRSDVCVSGLHVAGIATQSCVALHPNSTTPGDGDGCCGLTCIGLAIIHRNYKQLYTPARLVHSVELRLGDQRVSLVPAGVSDAEAI